jgi:hypothetical protein
MGNQSQENHETHETTRKQTRAASIDKPLMLQLGAVIEIHEDVETLFRRCQNHSLSSHAAKILWAGFSEQKDSMRLVKKTFRRPFRR